MSKCAEIFTVEPIFRIFLGPHRTNSPRFCICRHQSVLRKQVSVLPIERRTRAGIPCHYTDKWCLLWWPLKENGARKRRSKQRTAREKKNAAHPSPCTWRDPTRRDATSRNLFHEGFTGCTRIVYIVNGPRALRELSRRWNVDRCTLPVTVARCFFLQNCFCRAFIAHFGTEISIERSLFLFIFVVFDAKIFVFPSAKQTKLSRVDFEFLFWIIFGAVCGIWFHRALARHCWGRLSDFGKVLIDIEIPVFTVTCDACSGSVAVEKVVTQCEATQDTTYVREITL